MMMMKKEKLKDLNNDLYTYYKYINRILRNHVNMKSQVHM